ncbi:hypothetical protein K7X08_021166 [Anisodus acutangulus]|uniref:KIB1-4 beta-propeller domain-containing protein n=1 Tax=Anisodus acutangulus TaxID=402998 RepID=A0A9Q1LYV5_9SOLA|nr:hypothetical protein K7X08_021166 [Anisodus acutangulus]
MAVEVAAPLLMLAGKEENAEIRAFWELSKGVTYTMNFPELVGKYCVGVGFPGWLFSADEQGHMNLFHLFSRTLINLPDMDMLQGFAFQEELGCDRITYVQKALLSSDPLSSTDDYVLALIQGYPRTFAFWRLGSKSFTSVDSTITYCAFSDVTWHDGHFYGVSFMGNIVILDFTSDYYSTTAARVIMSQIPPRVACSNKVYIVYSMGELLVINRDGCHNFEEGDDSYGLNNSVYTKINDSSYEEVKDLGNRALFLGFSAILAVEPPPGCQGNRIYFTDDCREAYFCMERGGGKDMGVYNLLDGTIVPHYTGRAMTQLAVSMKDVLREMNELKPAYESSVQDSAEGESKSQDSDDSFAGDVGNDLSPEEMKIARLITDVVSCNTCGH